MAAGIRLKLLDEIIPFSKRLILAENAYKWERDGITTDSNESLAGKEQVVLDWFVDVLESEEDSQKLIELCEALQICISSPRTAVLGVNLKPKFALAVSRKIQLVECRKAVIDCLRLVLSQPGLFPFSLLPPDTFTEMIGQALKASVGLEEVYGITAHLSTVFQSYQGQQSDQSVFLTSVLKNAALPILQIPASHLDSKKWQVLLGNVIFADAFRPDWSKVALETTHIIQTILEFIRTVSDKDAWINLFTTLGHGYLRRYRDRGIQSLAVFALLCAILGFSPRNKGQQPLITDEVIFNLPSEINDGIVVQCLAAILKPLENHHLDFHSELKSISWLMFLQLLGQKLSKVTSRFEPSHALIYSTLITLNPAILLPSASILVEKSLQEPSSEASEDVLKLVLEAFVKLRNVPKLLTTIISLTHVPGQAELPESFLQSFGAAIEALALNQVMNLWGICNTHLKTEQPQQEGSILAMRLLTTLLLHVKVADNALPDTLIDQVHLSLEQTKEILASFPRNQGNLHIFLQCGLAWDELLVLLLLYNQHFRDLNSATVESLCKPSESDVADVSSLHYYLKAEEWKLIFEKNTSEPTLQNLLVKLVIQKIKATALMATDSATLIRPVVQYLFSKFPLSTFASVQNLELLFPYMHHTHFSTLADYVVGTSIGGEKNYVFVQSFQLLESKPFQIALVQAITRSIGQIFDSKKRKLDENPSEGMSSSLKTVWQQLSTPSFTWSACDREVPADLNKLLTQIADVILTSANQRVSFQNDPALRVLTDLIDALPLEYLNGSPCIVLLFAIVTLLTCVEFQVTSPDGMQSKKVLYELLVRLLDNPEKYSYIFTYFRVDYVTEFVLRDLEASFGSQDVIYAIAKLVVPSLMEEIVKSPDSITSLKSFTKSGFNSENLWHRYFQVVAMETLWSSVHDMKYLSMKQVTHKLFLRLAKKFYQQFKSVSLPDNFRKFNLIDRVTFFRGLTSYMKAYAATQRQEERNKQTKVNVTVLSLKMQKLLGHLRFIIKSSLPYITSTDADLGQAVALFFENHLLHLHNWPQHDYSPVRMELWKMYRQSPPIRWNDSLIQRILGMAQEGELNLMLDGFMADMEECCQKRGTLERTLTLWQHLVAADFESGKRTNLRTVVIQNTLPALETLVLEAVSEYQLDRDQKRLLASVIPVLDTFRTLVSVEKIYVLPDDLGSFFTPVLALPWNEIEDMTDFVTVFTAVYKILHSFLSQHEEIASDRIPLTLQLLRQLISAVATRADQNRKLNSAELENMVACAERIARLVSLTSNQNLRYRRVAAYIAADLLEALQQGTIYPAVKSPLMTAVYVFLSMLDQHATRFMMATLPAGSRELFKSEYDTYQKYIKFTGKL